jgi:hypothetical protein
MVAGNELHKAADGIRGEIWWMIVLRFAADAIGGFMFYFVTGPNSCLVVF